MNTKTIKALSVEELENISGGFNIEKANKVLGKVILFTSCSIILFIDVVYCVDIYRECNNKKTFGDYAYKNGIKWLAGLIKKI